MISPLEQIQDSVRRYIDREIQLHELEDIMLPLLWDMDGDHPSRAVELAGRAHNLIAEYAKGDRSEASLREELAKPIRPFVIVRGSVPPTPIGPELWESESSSRIERKQPQRETRATSRVLYLSRAV